MELLNLLQRPPNSAHKIVRRVPSIYYNDSIYGGKYAFDVDKNLGGLAQCWIKLITRTGGIDPPIVNVPQGLNILRYIRLVGETGPIQTLDRVTLIARTDLIIGSGLYEKLIDGLNGRDDPFAAPGTTVYFIPLFWFFSDLKGDYLDTRNIKNLRIEVATLPDVESMGMGIALTTLNIELFTYHIQPDKYVPKPISYSYDRYEEESVVVPIGVAEVRVLLKCPDPVFYTHFYLYVNSTAGSDAISSVRFDSPNGEMFDVDRLMNYLLSDLDDSTEPEGNSVFSKKFGERHGDSKDFITYSQTMNPTYATVRFVPSDEVRTLLTVSEYRSNILGGDRPYLGISGMEGVYQPPL